MNRVVAAHAEKGVVNTSAVRNLGPGAVVPHLTATNLVYPDVVRTAIQEAMAALGTRSRDVIAVLPDGACRTVLVDFDTLPARPDQAETVVRLRLKKSLPFEVERARVSYQVQGNEAAR